MVDYRVYCLPGPVINVLVVVSGWDAVRPVISRYNGVDCVPVTGITVFQYYGGR